MPVFYILAFSCAVIVIIKVLLLLYNDLLRTYACICRHSVLVGSFVIASRIGLFAPYTIGRGIMPVAAMPPQWRSAMCLLLPFKIFAIGTWHPMSRHQAYRHGIQARLCDAPLMPVGAVPPHRHWPGP